MVETCRKQDWLAHMKERAENKTPIKSGIIGYVADTCRQCPHAEIVTPSRKPCMDNEDVYCPGLVIRESQDRIPVGWVTERIEKP
jgi:hypothetical protein